MRELPGSYAQIAKPIGAVKQAVSKWWHGQAVPDERYRRALATHYGIPWDAWTKHPAGHELEAEDDQDDEPNDEQTELGAADDSPIADYLRLQRVLRKQLELPCTPRERVQLADAFQRAVAAKVRYEREREMVETRIVRHHPKWQKFKRALAECLMKHPAAARDVGELISTMLGDELEEGLDDEGGSEC